MQARADEERPSAARGEGEGWVAPARRGGRTALATLIVTAVLAGVGWLGSGRVLEDRARQRVADRWEALRVCLLGETGRHRPSEQLRLTRLAVEHGPEGRTWPSRCLPYAAALDEALEARAISSSLHGLPRAAPIIEAKGLRDHELDALVSAIEAADLPLPASHPTGVAAPSGTAAAFTGHRLEPLGAVERLDDVVVAFDPTSHRPARLMFPDPGGLRICRLDLERAELRCHVVGIEPPAGAGLELIAAPEGAGDLIRLRDAGEADGFYDGATGLPLWRSLYFDTQAIVGATGRVTLLSAALRDGARGERVEKFELVRIAPGKRPRTHALRLSPEGRAVLLSDAILHWQDGEREAHLGRTRFDDETIASAKPGGTLPIGSRPIAHCRDGGRDAVLVAAKIRNRPHALVVGAGDDWQVLPLGVIDGPVVLSCHGRAAMVTHLRAGVASRFFCEASCRQETTGALALPTGVQAVGSVGEKLALLWGSEGGPLRMRFGLPSELAEQRDRLVLDGASRSDLSLLALRIFDGGGQAVALIQDASLRVRALRIDAAGRLTPIRPAL